MYDKPFPKCKPSWLKGLQLDGYNADLKTACEYQGEQHYKHIEFFHKTVEEYEDQLANDKKKVQLCKDKGVKLCIIPFMRKNKLPQYISDLLQKKCGSFVFNQGKKLGLNLTDCMTGASLSKKSFMNDYYMPNKYPIYSLDDPMDQYIRDFYYGGRVEIFQLGRVKDKKFYYYDFTSLYPDRGREALPYGKPEWVTADKINPSDFFGFVDVKVKSVNT